jgi:predicted GNAT family acetyltransferase
MSTDVRRREHDYQITVDGVPAGVAQFRVEGDLVVFTHTTVEKAFEGQGIGSALAAAALDDVRAQGKRVVPLCPFIRAWIDKHPDYADLVEAA